ncbi:MAG: homoprotocatechuate degradation operon regulator HpaR [Actinomycetota bacterium]
MTGTVRPLDHAGGRPGGAFRLRPFEASLPMALLRARETAMRHFRPMLADHDLTEQQWRVLRALVTTDEPMEIGQVIDATFLLGPSLTRILANLGGRGLIDREVAAHDQRRALISLTPAGRDLVATVAPSSEAYYDEIERRFGTDRLAALMELLAHLEAIGGPEDDSPEQGEDRMAP